MSKVEIFIGSYPNEEYKIENLFLCMESCRAFELPINLVSSYPIGLDVSSKFDDFISLPNNPLVRDCDFMDIEIAKKHWEKTKYRLNFEIGEELLGFSEIGGLYNLSHQWASTYTLQQSIRKAKEINCDWLVYSESDIQWVGSSAELISSKIEELEKSDKCGLFLGTDLFEEHILATHMIIKCNSGFADLILELSVSDFYRITEYNPTVETCIYKLLELTNFKAEILNVPYFEGDLDIFGTDYAKQVNLWSKANLQQDKALSIFINKTQNMYTFLNKNQNDDVLHFSLKKEGSEIFSDYLYRDCFIKRELLLDGQYDLNISAGERNSIYSFFV